MKAGEFNGFSPDTRFFLFNLVMMNSREWFEEHREEYRECLLHPLQDLVRSLAETMLSIDPELDVAPVTGRTISRIYRDTRFSRDKSIFRGSMWITFKRPRKDWQDTPGFFFEINPVTYRYGMGFYRAQKSTMDRFRETIAKKPQEFLKTVAFMEDREGFRLEGDKYKRTLDPAQPPAIQDWYQRKSFYIACHREADDRLFSRGILDDLASGFQAAAPLYHYLWKVCRG
ncbi:MAG: DUF2461 domain-containing protein [Firmicutes bacterium]|nr:DUF2461 domain-containing protein [Bacillota bacterium]